MMNANRKPESISLATRAVVKTPPGLATPIAIEEPESISIPARTTEAHFAEGVSPTLTTLLVNNGDILGKPEEEATTVALVNNTRPLTMLVVKPLRVFVDIFLLVLVWLPTIVLAAWGKPFERGFYCDDESLRYPHKGSTVPNWLLYLAGTTLPVVCIIAIESFRVLSFEPQLYKKLYVEPYHQLFKRPVPPLLSNLYIYLGYFTFGAALCQGLTDLGKYSIGRLRPHFYDVCAPAIDCTKLPPYTYIIEPNCTTKDLDALKEARLSFPSGHSSFGMYTTVFLVMYIQARLVWPMASLLVKHILQQICIVLGVACALSRISDYRHHWSDVLTGVVLGVIVACLTAFHMLGLFRFPHRIFSPPGYLAVPNSDCSFGGDHFHSAAEIQMVEQHFQQQNGTVVSDLSHVTPVTNGVLHHRDAGNGV